METKRVSEECNQRNLIGKYMRVSQYKSNRNWRIPPELLAQWILFCFSCYCLCVQGLSVLRSNRFWGLAIKVWVASTADASCKWPCFYSKSKPVCLFFSCYNMAWHVKILCNLGAVVLSLELKHILLGRKKKALNLALHLCYANSKGFWGLKQALK